VWLGTPKYLFICRKNSRRAMFTARRKRSHCVTENYSLLVLSKTNPNLNPSRNHRSYSNPN